MAGKGLGDDVLKEALLPFRVREAGAVQDLPETVEHLGGLHILRTLMADIAYHTDLHPGAVHDDSVLAMLQLRPEPGKGARAAPTGMRRGQNSKESGRYSIERPSFTAAGDIAN